MNMCYEGYYNRTRFFLEDEKDGSLGAKEGSDDIAWLVQCNQFLRQRGPVWITTQT